MFEISNPKAHALVFPYPYQGHITPTFNLAAKLASTGFTVTYVLPEFLHRRTTVSNGGAAAGVGIRCAAISDGFSLEFDRDANLNEYWESMIHDFPARVDEFVESVKKSDESAATEFFLVADSLYTWPAEIATKHNLVNVSLWTEPALVFSIAHHLDLLQQNGHFPYKGSSVDYINYIPGVASIRTDDLMSNLQQPDAVPILNKILKLAFEQVKKADFTLFNTVEELESVCLSALRRRQPTYAVGPINFFTSSSSHRRESDCAAWLESKPPASVLYISVGSIFEFSEEEIREISQALLTCRANFLWVLKSANKEESVFPGGFLDGVGERGLVVPWCDQKLVLTSPAVGGFLTHCGWNSTLESMWAGVPMLCHPFNVDQPSNRKLLVEDWGIGISLCDGGRVTREEVSRKIHVLMEGEKGVELRQEVKRVREIVRSAVEREGSSQTNFDQFVRDLKGRLQRINEHDGLK